MLTLLAKLFIRDHDNTADPKVRTAYGMLCGLYGVFLNLLLFAGKYLAGSLAGSVAVTADAFRSKTGLYEKPDCTARMFATDGISR